MSYHHLTHLSMKELCAARERLVKLFRNHRQNTDIQFQISLIDAALQSKGHHQIEGA